MSFWGARAASMVVTVAFCCGDRALGILVGVVGRDQLVVVVGVLLTDFSQGGDLLLTGFFWKLFSHGCVAHADWSVKKLDPSQIRRDGATVRRSTFAAANNPSFVD
jgi:hypothetical protein